MVGRSVGRSESAEILSWVLVLGVGLLGGDWIWVGGASAKWVILLSLRATV